LVFTSLGLFGLFLASFLAATILPFSSELILAFFLTKGIDPRFCFMLALAGNFLGGSTNFWIGKLGNPIWLKRVGVTEETIYKRQHWIEKRGAFIAFFSWVPIIGDPLVVALGFFNSSIIKTHLWMFFGKALRYLIIVLGFLNWFA
jgi:membrane protein YqaA with SNARE-associated domain